MNSGEEQENLESLKNGSAFGAASFSASLKRLTWLLRVGGRSIRRRKIFTSRNSDENEEEEEEDHSSWARVMSSRNVPIARPSWRCFTYHEICSATRDFHTDNLVGRGGYAEVYMGVLADGHMVAVKSLSRTNTDEHTEKQFLSELGILGHVCHPNIATLLGCCIENGLHLIFTFYVDGNLASLLHGTDAPGLDWDVRYRVAVGIARGLHYLHNCCQRRVIHRDLTASNILLGPDFDPKISDFGLAKWLPRQWTHLCVSQVEGTLGYLAPEYFSHGIVDEKTDVFAFGVLLLEIISGHEPIDSSGGENIISWAKPLIDSDNVAEIVDPKLHGEHNHSQLRRLAFTASACLRHFAVWRPTMVQVLQCLTEDKFEQEEEDYFRLSAEQLSIQEEQDAFWGFDESEIEIGVGR